MFASHAVPGEAAAMKYSLTDRSSRTESVRDVERDVGEEKEPRTCCVPPQKRLHVHIPAQVP